MRIEGNRPNSVGSANEAQQSQASQAAEQARNGQSSRADEAASTSQGDRVRLSSDAKLLGSAVKAASQSPDIRPDVVERARQKLAAGEVGRDVVKLADRMIDSFLSR